MSEGFSWYWRRLLAMSPGEIAARLAMAARKALWRRRSSWQAPGPRPLADDGWGLCEGGEEAAAERRAVLAEADDYLRGEYALLNVTFTEPEINWHLDPQSGVQAPMSFGPDLNYRDPDLVGNVKNIWEKNRHRHLTVLALAHALSGDERYADEAGRQMLSWLWANPFPTGVNWSSPLELGLRLVSWVWIQRLLKGSQAHERFFGRRDAFWGSVYWHQRMIERNRSFGSSANNHLIGEMAGQFIAGSVWPVFAESARWRRTARKILEQEIRRQTFPDGLNREQAFGYHVFSLELFVLAGIEAERPGKPFSAGYKDLVRRMIEAVPPLVDTGGNIPRYGDGDDGMAVQLGPRGSSRLDWLYRLCRSWLGAAVPVPRDGSGSLAAGLVWPDCGDFERIAPVVRGSVAYPEAGVYVLTSRRGESREILCLADAGPLGYLSTAAHGHADALSFTLAVGGVPVIVDPGTCCYHYDPGWREYFRSTAAHNTVVVDGESQSAAAGAFLWVRKARARVLEWRSRPEGGTLSAEHDGYTRLRGEVVHRRRFSLEGKRLEIYDDLKGRGEHSLEWRLHLSPECTAGSGARNRLCEAPCGPSRQTVPGTVSLLVSWDGGKARLGLDPRLKWRLAVGEEGAGWYSRGFNLREPTCTIVGACRTALPASFRSFVEILDED